MFTTASRNDLCATPNLKGLMALYESNYARTYKLFPGREDDRSGAVSIIANDLPLHLTILERCRYTTTYRLTYYFSQGSKHLPDPDLEIRVYHDARQAEALSCGRNQHCPMLLAFKTDQGSDLQRKWQLNLLLNKWLRYCLDRGHRFPLKPFAPFQPRTTG